MKPFNLEKAKAGKPVVDFYGDPVRILCFDLKNDETPIVAIRINMFGEEEVRLYSNEGLIDTYASDPDWDSEDNAKRTSLYMK